MGTPMLLNFMLDTFMCVAAVLAVLAVATIWIVGLFAINDMALNPIIQDAQRHPLIRNIINKIEELRNARS